MLLEDLEQILILGECLGNVPGGQSLAFGQELRTARQLRDSALDLVYAQQDHFVHELADTRHSLYIKLTGAIVQAQLFSAAAAAAHEDTQDCEKQLLNSVTQTGPLTHPALVVHSLPIWEPRICRHM